MSSESFIQKFEPYGNLGMFGVRLPTFKVDQKYYAQAGVSSEVDNYTLLKALCENGLQTRGINGLSNFEEYSKRLDSELNIFNELGFVDYILLIWDIINYAHDNGIATGAGRGSAGACLVLYLIGVIGIDPIKYGLYFERFVSRARAKKTVIDGITYLKNNDL